MRRPPDVLPLVRSGDHGGLLVYRLWHPAPHTPSAAAMRSFGPLFRFDPHPERDVPVDDPDANPPVWYGGETFETAVREVLDRDGPAGPRIIEVCVRQRLAALRLPQPTDLIDLTRHGAALGADDDLGDRVDELSYTETRAWARWIYDRSAPSGLRYHSARHRTGDGGRAGVNVCVWSPSASPVVVSNVPATRGGAWARVHTMLTKLGAAPRAVHGCRRCR